MSELEEVRMAGPMLKEVNLEVSVCGGVCDTEAAQSSMQPTQWCISTSLNPDTLGRARLTKHLLGISERN